MSHDQVTSRPRIRRIVLAAEVAVPIALVAGVFLLHDIPYDLRVPYWNDEAWVAVSTKTSLASLTRVTGPSPLGWTALLRLIVVGGQQRARLVPVLFAGLTSAAAYWLGRELGNGRIASLGAGVVALFVPAMLLRNDLKQYTAEAFVALLIAVLLVRSNHERSRRRLVVLSVGCVLALPFANATLFTGSAALLAVALVALGGRDWPRLREVLVAGVVTAGAWALWLVLFVFPHQSQSLVDFWDAYYPPRTIGGLHAYLSLHIHLLAGPYAGMHSGTVLVVSLGIGLLVLALTGDAALALMPMVAFAGMVVSGLLRLFPVLNERTSTWLLTFVPVLVFVSFGRVLSGDWQRRRWPRRAIVPVVGGLVVLATAGSYAYAARADVRAHTIPFEDARDQAKVVLAERRAGDIVVVDLGADYAFAFYGGETAPIPTVPSTANPTGYFVDYRDPDVLALHDRTAAVVEAAYVRASLLAARTPGARIWLVRMHMQPAEEAAWAKELTGADVLQQDADGLIEVAPDR